jgi:outer membrane protein OmpA-like peptidoglycan-associated protein
MLTAGCATKKYVQNTTAPIQAKVDQVGDQTTQNSQQIQDTKSQVAKNDEKAQNGISAASEKAGAADQHAADAMNHANDAMGHANDAMTRATTADQKSDQNAQSLSKLRDAVANIDDYKLQTTVVVPFKFDKAGLTADTKQDLDKLAQDIQANKRFFIAVEGYTDTTGSRAYNETLSRKRADAVVEYLVAKHDIPIYRIHMIGLGVDKPVDDARTRDARAKNRRVEVKVFSADQVTGSLSDSSSSANRADGTVTGH